MNKIALALTLRDRVVTASRVIEPLLQPDKFDLWLIDGSSTTAGEDFAMSYAHKVRNLTGGVRGGPDAAIVYALTVMLSDPSYTHVGLCEQDTLLHPDWFGPTRALFDRGRAEGLEVGAVSARCYDDRILVQRDGYALCHNLGAGHVIFSRKAAELILRYYRTGWTLENRRVFAQLASKDIGAWWCFRGGQHHITADWHFDTILAAHGLASLALTPCLVDMIGQDPPLHALGLRLVDRPVDILRDDRAFGHFCDHTEAIRAGALHLPMTVEHLGEDGLHTWFAHQILLLNGASHNDWRLRWSQGFGPFAWEAGEDDPFIEMQVSGPCSIMASGGRQGGRVRVTDEQTGYDFTPELPPEGEHGQVLHLAIPASVAYRTVRLSALTPGVRFYGVTTREQQPVMIGDTFDHSWLPPVA
jgi:hypothetical protein